jgi:hypothetical protein
LLAARISLARLPAKHVLLRTATMQETVFLHVYCRKPAWFACWVLPDFSSLCRVTLACDCAHEDLVTLSLFLFASVAISQASTMPAQHGFMHIFFLSV